MHSQIIDDIGRYGILGAFLILGIYFRVFTGVRDRTRGAPRYYAMSALALAALLAVLNPVMFPGVGFVALGMIPLFASLAVERRSQ